ncbi:MAG: type II secretion system protein GspL [Candidatus Muproteobacteria bacterium RBG_16_64_11]|uniref:Type II secretion system protein GspL n=1 Tax=Candidatus Muproteobacteria bacterium RBG_16_64_11 TaxID=1817758 RepID=A0A1F6TAJ8_9PROT|nr:MAG: type II secretion system protein GspL [Candidatus Muproteobacteria bacterium RBG_16_64_11]
MTRVNLPTRQRAKILQALPFALEDQLLGEPETLYFSYRNLPDGSLAVAVTAQERFQGWLAAFKAAGLHLVGLCPVTLRPPLEEGCWSIGFDAEEVYVRSGELAGFACPVSLAAPPAVLRAALREAGEQGRAPRELIAYNPPAQFSSAAWSEALGLPVSVREQPAAGPAPFNLLQREFAPSGELRESLRAMRPAAIMLGAWLIAAVALNLWQWWSLASDQRAARAEMTELFQKSFPEAKTVVDPGLQMERNLAILQANSGMVAPSDMLSLLNKTSQILQGNPQTKLRGLQYGDGALTLDLNFPDFKVMETMKNALAGRGLQVEILSANSRGTGVDTRLRLRTERRS